MVGRTSDAGRRGMMRARALDGLAQTRQRSKRFAGTESLLLESIELWSHLLGETQPRVAISLYNLGVTYAQLDRPAQARDAFERALSIFLGGLGEDSAEVVRTRQALERIGSPESPRSGSGS